MTEGEPYDKGVRKNQYGDFKPVRVSSEGMRYSTDIIYFKTAESEGKVYHSTQKPVELRRYLIRTFTEEGAIILDNACGSGSFLISAIMENRNFIGIEKNEGIQLYKNYEIDLIDICNERIDKAYKKMVRSKKII